MANERFHEVDPSLVSHLEEMDDRMLLKLERREGEEAIDLAPYSWVDEGRPEQKPPPGDWRI